MNTQPFHAQGVYDTVRLAYGVPLDEDCEDCINPKDVIEQLDRFPEGQFVAVVEQRYKPLVVGMASTMRTNIPPALPQPPWVELIGSLGIAGHRPDGEWLYGVEMAVMPRFRRRGIGTALYTARFELAKRLNLRGWYAVGMLMGYYRYKNSMSIEEYARKVQYEELRDPTVSMQIHRGFEARGLVTGYLDDEPDASGAGMLIVWENPDYKDPG